MLACMGGAFALEGLTVPLPTSRDIPIEAFRYGTSPAILRANRGDVLTLSFSTRDTGHSFFLQDYRIDAKISPAAERVEVRDPLAPDALPVDLSKVTITAGLPGFWGNLVSVSRFRCHVYCGPMHGFEQGDLIVRPNWLLAGSMGALLSMLLVGGLLAYGHVPSPVPTERPGVDLNGQFAVLKRLLKWRPLQFLCTLPVLGFLTVVVLSGFLGTKVGGRNGAVMFVWVGWLSLLTLFLVPLAGRLWCLVCPVPVLGDYLQRGTTVLVRSGKSRGYGNRFRGLLKVWPSRLRGTWVRLVLFLCMGILSATLAGKPQWTSMAILAMVLGALGMSLVWELRAFCRYICPVASYLSAYGSVARLAVESRDAEICRRCRERACLKGNDEGWACPYGLLVATMKDGRECGMCMECFKSCPHENVRLVWRRGAVSHAAPSYGHAWQNIAFLTMAAVSSLTFHSPWPQIRDMVNIVDKASWSQVAAFSMGALGLALLVLPAVFWLLSLLGIRLSQRFPRGSCEVRNTPPGRGPRNSGDAFRGMSEALTPLGLALWMAFFASTLMVNFTFLLMTLSDPLGWGWDLLGTAGIPWVQILPGAIPWLQTLVVLMGLLCGLRRGFRIWLALTGEGRSAFWGFLPTAGFMGLFSGGMLLYFTNY